MKLETKVGAFFLLSIAILCLLILRSEKLEIMGKNRDHEYLSEFQQVAGLSIQGHVRVAGVKLGEVRNIQLKDGKAQVYFSVGPEQPIYQDAVAQLSSIGILGEKYIELDPGHPSAGLMPQNGTIKSKSGIGLDNLMETLGAIGQDVKGITYALNKSIGGEEGRAKLDEIVDNIRVLTAEFRSMSQENHAAINHTISNVESLSGELKDRLPKLAQQFEDLGKNLNDLLGQNKPELKGLITDIRKLAQGFQATSDNIRMITDKMNKGEGTIGKLLNDETTVKKINAAVDNVNEFLGGLKTMDLRLDMNAAQWTKRGESKIGLGIDIVPRPDYWYALELNSTPDGKIQDSSRTITAIDPNTGLPRSVLEKTRTVTSDQAFTLSAQFAKRLGKNLVATAGIVDSRGGTGLEFRAVQDRFRIGALAYDFTKRDDKPKPRYRLTTSYQFWKGLYGHMGAQDIANKELRTFFIGGGLRWKDDDLKKLVGLAAGGK